MIAKDILAIPVSTVVSESAFSTSGRLLNPHRSRLDSKTVEALMCTQNWLFNELRGVAEFSPDVDGSTQTIFCENDGGYDEEVVEYEN
ncbi:unnamed protein product [Linum trigynum]|uniref:HAT C-terminal dimerisation domain-containing protein n=1 Tax=Linum trigynum TaxID=586398 RepID=A0AAV2GGA0_9ROSI